MLYLPIHNNVPVLVLCSFTEIPIFPLYRNRTSVPPKSLLYSDILSGLLVYLNRSTTHPTLLLLLYEVRFFVSIRFRTVILSSPFKTFIHITSFFLVSH